MTRSWAKGSRRAAATGPAGAEHNGAMPAPYISTSKEGVVLRIFVQPRAARNAVGGMYGDALKIKVTAPPVEGKANAAVEALLAEILGVPPSRVTVVAGGASRNKKVVVAGADAADVEGALGHVLSSPAHERR